jgi:hypothetical protein
VTITDRLRRLARALLGPEPARCPRCARSLTDAITGCDCPTEDLRWARAVITTVKSVHRRHECDGATPEECGCAADRAESDTGEVCGHCTRPYPCPTRSIADQFPEVTR